MKQEFSYPSHGAGRLYACRWEPEGEPCAVVQLVHGVAEYVDRYDTFARFLNQHGILVVGEDHMGHGRSIGADDTAGYFTGGWNAATADVYTLYEMTHATAPTLPYFLLGHSMGSFLVRTVLFRYPYSALRGALLLGSAWQSAAALRAGRALTAQMVQLEGERAVSASVQNLLLGIYSQRTAADDASPYAWVCSDKAAMARFEADPLCGFPITNGLARDMIAGLCMIQNRKNLERMLKTVPVLFLSGDQDPVGGMGRGVLNACHAFRQAGMLHTSMKLYAGLRHELLNETQRETVAADILFWMTEIIGNSAKYRKEKTL